MKCLIFSGIYINRLLLGRGLMGAALLSNGIEESSIHPDFPDPTSSILAIYE